MGGWGGGGEVTKTKSINDNFQTESASEAESNRDLSAYLPNALITARPNRLTTEEIRQIDRVDRFYTTLFSALELASSLRSCRM